MQSSCQCWLRDKIHSVCMCGKRAAPFGGKKARVADRFACSHTTCWHSNEILLLQTRTTDVNHGRVTLLVAVQQIVKQLAGVLLETSHRVARISCGIEHSNSIFQCVCSSNLLQDNLLEHSCLQ